MVSLISVFVSQIQLFLLGSAYLLFRCIVSGDERDVLEMLPEEFKINTFCFIYLFFGLVFFLGLDIIISFLNMEF
ncbi:MAG: hypothetical protein BWY54_00950 [Candidatus Dependentiae bacterium ADurb.Bin331]|nr:MAG: hypothetical protein BWY54_00950 [Candidatus Dependentiae bacterium ADurb.Bin331]